MLGHNAPMRFLVALPCLLLCLLATPVAAEALRVAVAASFLPALKQLEPAVKAELSLSLEPIPGASGLLYAQMVQGAPYDLFLSADKRRPRALVEAGHADATTLKPYTRGALVLWSPHGTPDADWLHRRDTRLAMANPVLAPYGEAAQSALAQLAPEHDLQLVTGTSVGQALHFARSGNADMALVAHAQILALPMSARDRIWPVPDDLYEALDHEGVVPVQSRKPDAARRLLDWLRAPPQQEKLAQMGYLPIPGGQP